MRIRRRRTSVGMLFGILALCLAGCGTAQQVSRADEKAADEAASAAEEARGVAEASLGKQAEVLARGDLAQDGREQLLVVNRFSKSGASDGGVGNPSLIFVTRAAILEKDGGKWSEILRCDEHLKNPYGYLGGSPAARVSGWRLEYSRDAKNGLEMKLTPAEGFGAVDANADKSSEQKRPTFDIRWNKNVKRYQSFEESHEKYLTEVPTLETPESILR